MTFERESDSFTANRSGVSIIGEKWLGPSGAPVVLIHGAGNSMAAWPDAFCRRLARGRPVIRFDARDTGRSTSWPVGEPGYGLEDLVEDVIALVDTAGHTRFHVVGVSMGGAVAQLLALKHPERVLSMTVISGTPGGPGHDAADLPAMTSEMEAVFSAETPPPDWSDRDEVLQFLVDGERPFLGPRGFDIDQQHSIAVATVDRANDLEASLTNHFLVQAGPAWRERLDDIRVPTLIVHGEEDPLFPLEHGRALHAAIPESTLLILDGHGHGFPPPREWDVLVEAIEKNIERGRPGNV